MTLEYDPTLAKQPWPQTGHVTPTASCGPKGVSETPSLCDLAPHSEGFFSNEAPAELLTSTSIDDASLLLRWLATGSKEIPQGDPGADEVAIIQGREVRFSEIDGPLVRALNVIVFKGGREQNYEYPGVFFDRHLIMLHRILTNARGKQRVDHISGDTLDNRRSNLRICTHAQNMRNRKRHKHASTEFKGVQRYRARWRARLRLDGVQYTSPAFATPAEAAVAYDELAKKYHGEFARLNFPPPPFDSEHTQQRINRTYMKPLRGAGLRVVQR